MKGLLQYTNKYAGRTVFILGNGTELNSIDSSLLKDQIVIGCNASHIWKNDPTFMIAGHAIFPMLWENNTTINDTGVFHGLPELLLQKTIMNTQSCISGYTQYFKREITENDYLVGCDMVGFSATHLALIIGAANIVYIGFDSKYPNHYYDFEPYYDQLKKQTDELIPLYKDNQVLMNEIFDFQERHLPPGNKAMGFVLDHYYKHLERFSSLFYILRNIYGIHLYATQSESITVNAGAMYKPLGELL